MDLFKKLQLEMAIKEQRSILPEFLQLCQVTATQMKMYYDSLRQAGFTNEQAMDLLSYHGVDVGRMSHMDKGGNQND
ncbi:hypothetical protein [Clostridium formicaceticum]|uniref:Uncharacterized protein n=1 Tax=Clostridium formicaceticum TaxID=1497 RepID=A0AAC9RLX6_9CLOT|nr:hypothetical protein [Clostridium formicaceticum]AOY77216.1 hypothetical protein BJL90_15985 [Clostridium formicaceticum]ARE87745.1 hypothetical protein CLFO_21450 [Clostridium formicaceticum]